ncbi:YqcC family protein [Alteromonas portus]|uniref:YqcC family protein n=1 Tax=Alteromonas portus TaxID=2565549 RepID=UPI003BF82866
MSDRQQIQVMVSQQMNFNDKTRGLMLTLSPWYTARFKIKAFVNWEEDVIKTNSTHHIALSKALIQLETDMYQDGIWPDEEPAEHDLKNAMESAVPFAVDCLAFESWLAFIFIPKMRVLLTHEQPLPPMQITPAAEIYLSSANQRTLSQLQRIDNIANGNIG